MRSFLFFIQYAFVSLLLIHCFLWANPLKAQEQGLENYQKRQFEQQKLDKLRQNPDFNYQKKALPTNTSLWQRLRQWLWETFIGTTNTKTKREIWRCGGFMFSAFLLSCMLFCD